MNFASALKKWVTDDDPIMSDAATFVIELSIKRAFPNSFALQDHARDTLRAIAYNTAPDLTSHGVFLSHSEAVVNAVKAKFSESIKFYSVFLGFADTIPRQGWTIQELEVINERIHTHPRQAVAKKADR